MSRQEEFDQVKATVEAVAMFDERERLDRSPFHLSACGGCGAPSFQQPCSLCGYYPYGSDKGTWSPKTASFADFAVMVGSSGPGGRDGSIATWHARSRYKGRVDMAAEEAAAAGEAAAEKASGIDCCDIQTVWDVVVSATTSVTREREPLHVTWGWSGLFEARGVAEGRYSRNGGDPESVAHLRKAAEAWVEAVHGDDAAGMTSALEQAQEACRNLEVRVGPNGNLSVALDYIGKAREAVGQAYPGNRP